MQGLVRTAAKEIRECGREAAVAHIRTAVATMRPFAKVRAPYFKALLIDARRKKLKPDAAREIVRLPGNPMLRHGAVSAAAEPIAEGSAQGGLLP
ncbi:MAG: hypothetical protein ACRET0_13770 [Steroidobacteraceae bacterium]